MSELHMTFRKRERVLKALIAVYQGANRQSGLNK